MDNEEFLINDTFNTNDYFQKLDIDLHNLIICFLKKKSISDFHTMYTDNNDNTHNMVYKYHAFRNMVYEEIRRNDKESICDYFSKELIVDRLIEKCVFKSGYRTINDIFRILYRIFITIGKTVDEQNLSDTD